MFICCFCLFLCIYENMVIAWWTRNMVLAVFITITLWCWQYEHIIYFLYIFQYLFSCIFILFEQTTLLLICLDSSFADPCESVIFFFVSTTSDIKKDTILSMSSLSQLQLWISAIEKNEYRNQLDSDVLFSAIFSLKHHHRGYIYHIR